MTNLFWPRMSLPALGRMLVIAVVGAVIAGAYGILHDQVTFTISPEYFTKFKLHQFYYLGAESGMRVLVLKIGFLATWWVGFFAGWFMGRVLVPKMGLRAALSLSLKGFLFVFLGALLGGTMGFFLGGAFPDCWESIRSQCVELGVDDVSAFIRLACIHNAGYLGAFLGLVAVLFWIRKVSGSNSRLE